MFREALGADGVVERRGRRLTELRRRSTLLAGLSPEEQEHLRELPKRSLKEQGPAKRSAANFDSQLYYSIYLEREDVNFALFCYVCEQNAEMEDITKEIEQLKRAVELQRVGDAAASQEREDWRRKLEMTREQVTQATSKLQTEAEKVNKVLRLIKAGVEDMAARMGISPTHPAGSCDWTDNTITREMLSLLGLMEQRITDMLTVQSYLESQGQEIEDAAAPIPHFPRPSPPDTFHPVPVPSIHPPSISTVLDSEGDCDEDNLKAFSTEELKQRAEISAPRSLPASLLA